MKQIFDDYINYLKASGYSKWTIKNRKVTLNKIKGFMKNQFINDFNQLTPSRLIDFKYYLIDKKLTQYVVNTHMKIFRIFMTYLVKNNIIKENHFDSLKKDFKVTDLDNNIKAYYDKYLVKLTNENISLTTTRNMKSSLKSFFKYLTDIDITSFNDVTRDILKSYIESLIDKEKSNGDKYYSITSINVMIRHLKGFILWMNKKGLLLGKLTGLSRLKEPERITGNILTRKEVSKLFSIEVNTYYDFMMKTLLVTLYSTGLRINELLNLCIKDIDFENNTLLIYESKEKKERFVHIGEVALNYLRLFIDKVRENISYGAETRDKVFISTIEGKTLRDGTVNSYLKKLCRNVKIDKNISSHCFRRSYGSHILENGASIKKISELLGHRKLSTTERYTKLSTENLRNVINKCHPRESEDLEWN